ncbi:ParB N-terminal domain-containing protein [Nitrobacter sp. TKz-YC02]|uniref:ParB N-terminal domain-containing protein n=1 Tax=Nitrobacter sp. TKz-YC02 TaxID=3398704 RepID=UPI003CFB7B76
MNPAYCKSKQVSEWKWRLKVDATSKIETPLSIVYQDIAALNPRKSNPRTHSKKQIDQLARAISQFGFTNPVLVDDANPLAVRS